MENPIEQLDGQPKEQVIAQPAAPEITIDQRKLDRYMDRLRLEQNLPIGLLAGFGAAIVGAIAWAAITVATEYQIGYMALAIGLLVGFVIKFTGKGIDQIFGISGAVLALIGCLLGNFLSVIGFLSIAAGLDYFDTLALIELNMIPDLMMDTFSPMDLLFYGIAVYEGYRFSFRNVSEEDIIANTAE